MSITFKLANALENMDSFLNANQLEFKCDANLDIAGQNLVGAAKSLTETRC